MSNAIFPTLKGLGFPVVKRPIFSTIAQEAVSGKKKKIGNWLFPRWEIELTFNYLREFSPYAELQTLGGFFLARQGHLDSFLFDDPDDNFIAAQQLGVGDGATRVFQLIRSFGGFLEPCLNIKTAPAPKIYLNGILQTAGYSIGLTDSGLVTFTTAPLGVIGLTPAQVITADFGFYWRCCFKDDQEDLQKFLHKAWSGKITLETVK